MSVSKHRPLAVAAICVGLVPLQGLAFDSGSTGADGAFNPVVGTELQLPPTGIFNFTSVSIPNGVAVTFRPNATNTPVVMLVQGDAVIAGTIQVSGGASPPTGRAGDGNLADDGQPGKGGPGGFDGGWGGPPGGQNGARGLGPGGGREAGPSCNDRPASGGGGGFGTAGGVGDSPGCGGGSGGSAYGTTDLLPLIGGSGGGGGFSNTYFHGAGGGGGGGAITVAVSGTLTFSGNIVANGGNTANTDLHQVGSPGRGGGGSGGAVRLVASTLAGAGSISAMGGWDGNGFNGPGDGGTGRVRLEAEVAQFMISSSPAYTISATTGPVFLPNMPGLAIVNVGGFAVPAQPSGSADVTLPVDAPNPVNIAVESHGVPVGSVVRVRVVPQSGAAVSADSPPTTGTQDTASTSVDLNIPDGASVIEAETTFTVTAALEERLAPYAQGERVESVRLTATPGQPSSMVLLTASGCELEVPAAALAAGW